MPPRQGSAAPRSGSAAPVRTSRGGRLIRAPRRPDEDYYAREDTTYVPSPTGDDGDEDSDGGAEGPESARMETRSLSHPQANAGGTRTVLERGAPFSRH